MSFIDVTAKNSWQLHDNVNWVHLVLASGKLVRATQKIILITGIFYYNKELQKPLQFFSSKLFFQKLPRRELQKDGAMNFIRGDISPILF